MRFLCIAAALLLASSCTAIPINLPKVDGSAPTAELGGGFDAAGASDKGISMDGGVSDFGPVPSGDASAGDGLLDGLPTDAQPTDGQPGDGQPADAAGEAVVGDGQPPPVEGGTHDTGRPSEAGVANDWMPGG